MFNDDNLPDWFAKDEHGHMKKPLPVSKEQIEYYRERQKAIDARPIKKIAEAKARKQRKVRRGAVIHAT
jgi:AdoMet-dependent rRNA methyltransferase SPB1